MLSINNLLILLILSFLITNVKLDLGGPCFSMSTMEGFACGLGVHKNIQIITDCLCYIPGYWEQLNGCDKLVLGPHHTPIDGAEICSRALEYAANPAGFTGETDYYESSTTVMHVVMLDFPTYSPGVTNFLDSSSNNLTTTNTDEINSLITTDEVIPSSSSSYIEIPLETLMESSISTQPSTIETSETSHATSLEVSSIITGVSSEPLTIVSESGDLNSTEIASTPVVITSPTPQPLLETPSQESSSPNIDSTTPTTIDNTVVDGTTTNDATSVASSTSDVAYVYIGGAMGYPSISVALGLVFIAYLV